MRHRKNPYHPDISLFLLLIPFISAFNYYLTYTNIRVSWFLLLTFTIDTVQGYVAWWAVRSFIVYLDRRWPYGEKPINRILFQVPVTTVIGLAIISILTEAVSWIARGRPAPLNFYTVDLFIISIWFIVINGVYIGLHYYNTWRRSEERLREEARAKSDGLMVRLGKQDIRLRFDEIAGFFVDGEYVAVCHLDGKKYYHDQSLDKLEKQLPTTYFFRLNRQFIVHHQSVSGFRRLENGKLQIQLKNPSLFSDEVQVSRLKAPAFKGWFRSES